MYVDLDIYSAKLLEKLIRQQIIITEKETRKFLRRLTSQGVPVIFGYTPDGKKIIVLKQRIKIDKKRLIRFNTVRFLLKQ
ncbi:MAG: hypothetical protein QW175_07380 [Candidatus Bathyarchaeia archaeon]